MLALSLLICFSTSTAWANTGTPLMWAGLLHLSIGNLLIGVLEGSLLAVLFRVKWRRTVGWMILANYFSALAGMLLVFPAAGLADIWKERLLDMAGVIIAIMLSVAFAMTVLLEWPFCTKVLRGKLGWDRKALKMSLAAQVVSYAILIPLYAIVAPISLLTDVVRVPSVQLAKAPAADVYYINPRDGDIWRIRTDGTGNERLFEANITERDTRLVVVPSEGGHTGDLCSLHYDGSAGKLVQLIPDVAPNGRYAVDALSRDMSKYYTQGGPARTFRPGRKTGWTAWMGWWPADGIRINRDGREVYSLALETPFVMAFCDYATALPTDQLVCQVGDQIVLLDMPTRKMAVLAVGRGPAVVLRTR